MELQCTSYTTFSVLHCFLNSSLSPVECYICCVMVISRLAAEIAQISKYLLFGDPRTLARESWFKFSSQWYPPRQWFVNSVRSSMQNAEVLLLLTIFDFSKNITWGVWDGSPVNSTFLKSESEPFRSCDIFWRAKIGRPTTRFSDK